GRAALITWVTTSLTVGDPPRLVGDAAGVVGDPPGLVGDAAGVVDAGTPDSAAFRAWDTACSAAFMVCETMPSLVQVSVVTSATVPFTAVLIWALKSNITPSAARYPPRSLCSSSSETAFSEA